VRDREVEGTVTDATTVLVDDRHFTGSEGYQATPARPSREGKESEGKVVRDTTFNGGKINFFRLRR
jgi:hypothetical protein